MRITGVRAATAAALLMLGLVAKAEATTIVYSSGHDIDTVAAAMGSVYVAPGNPTWGFFPSSGNVSAAIGGAYGSFDAFVVGESQGSWDASAKTALFNYTTGGGHTVVLGAHGSEVNFLNSTFGLSVTGYSPAPSSWDHATINRVAGTGPATLQTLNGSWFIDNAPGTVLYEHSGGGVAAFVLSVGSGTLSWLAWDFCECGEPDQLQADWFSVLGAEAISEGGVSAPVPEPATMSLLGLGLAGAWRARRRRQQNA